MTTMTKTTHIQLQIDDSDPPRVLAAVQKIYEEVAAAKDAGKTDGVSEYVDGSRTNIKRVWVDQAAADEHIAKVLEFAQESGITVLSAVVLDGGSLT